MGRPRALWIAVTLCAVLALVTGYLGVFWPWAEARFVQSLTGANWPLIDPSHWSTAAEVLALRTDGLILVTAILAFLGTVLVTGVLLGLWMQARSESRYRRGLSWAVGASAAHLRAEWMGTARVALRFAVPGLAVMGLGAVSLLRTFPGQTRLDFSLLAAALIPVTGLLVSAWFRAGRQAGQGLRGRPRSLGAPEVVVAFSIAGLTTALIQGEAGRPDVDEAFVGSVALAEVGLADPGRALELASLLDQAEAAGTPLAASSVGAEIGLGPVALVRTECGACFVGGLPVPVMILRARVLAVARDSFPSLGLTIAEGRDFARSDVGGPLVAAVSRSLANRYFERGDAIGRPLYLDEAGWRVVVAIVEDHPALGERDLGVYLPLEQVVPDRIEFRIRAAEALDRVQTASIQPFDLAELIESSPLSRLVAIRAASDVLAGPRWFGRTAEQMGALLALVAFLGTWRAARGWSLEQRYETGLIRALGATRQVALRARTVAMLKLFLLASTVGLWMSLFGGAYLKRVDDEVPMFDPLVAAAVLAWVGLAFLLGAFPGILESARRSPGEVLAAGAEQASD